MYILCKYIDYLESDLDTGPWFSMFDNSNGKTNRALVPPLSIVFVMSNSRYKSIDCMIMFQLQWKLSFSCQL